MAATNILNNRTAVELADMVRRLLGDVGASPVVPAESLRELVIAEYILSQHELGWNPQVPLRPVSGNALLSYTLAAGDYQTTQETAADLVASSDVYTDRMLRPLQFRPREELESWINNDVTARGAVQRGMPLYWTIRIDWDNGTPPTEMLHRMLVYPAADAATVIYWPRAVVDTGAVDPSSTGKIPLSYQGTWGLEFKVASMCVRRMSAKGLERLGIDRGFADVLWAEWLAARDREKAERFQHALPDYIIERNA